MQLRRDRRCSALPVCVPVCRQAGWLDNILSRFSQGKVHTVYEAGSFGFWLHDHLAERGYSSTVTPPSLVPRIGGKVKTDRRDSKKLASMLAGGFLKRVYLLTPEERADRELVRTRNQIERDRKRVQRRIKAKLLFHGIAKTKWLFVARSLDRQTARV